VREISGVAQVDAPVEGFTQLRQRGLAAVHAAAPVAQRRGMRIEIGQRAVGAADEQQADFLEAFTHRGDEPVEPAVRQPEPRAGRGIVQAVAPAPRLRIGGVEHAAGEDAGAAAEVVVAAFRAPHHQHLDAARPVAQHQQRRCRADVRRRSAHGCTRPAAGLSRDGRAGLMPAARRRRHAARRFHRR
jgi:hypothetical protein